MVAVGRHGRHKSPQCFHLHVVKARIYSLELGFTERRPKSDPAAVMRGEGEDKENRRSMRRAGTTRKEQQQQQQWQLPSHEKSQTSEPLCSASH